MRENERSFTGEHILLFYRFSPLNLLFFCPNAEHVSLSSVRLKKIQEKKKQLRERTELEIAARLAALGPIAEPANMLTEERDEDLLFE